MNLNLGKMTLWIRSCESTKYFLNDVLVSEYLVGQLQATAFGASLK